MTIVLQREEFPLLTVAYVKISIFARIENAIVFE